MSPSTQHLFLIAGLLLVVLESYAQPDSFRLHGDFPYIRKKDKLAFDVAYTSQKSFKGSVLILGYKKLGDSDIVVFKKNERIKFRKGNHIRRINFKVDDTSSFYSHKFYEVLKRAEVVPPGSYKTVVEVNDSSKKYDVTYCREVDSVISPTSRARRDINEALGQKKKRSLFRKYVAVKSPTALTSLKKSRKKVSKAIQKKGLRYEESERPGKHNIDMYYEDWFAGRYEMNPNEPISDQIKRQQEKAKGFGAGISTDMDKPSLFSQFKSANKNRAEDEETKGSISSTTYLSSDREPNSQLANNYEELRGAVTTTILNVPVEIEGLYTTQDRNRKIKSSFIHAHYDNKKAKSELKQSIQAYNTKFEEGKSRAIGLESMYGASIGSMEGQKDRLMRDLDTKGGLGLNTAEAESKKKKIEELDKKISKYRQLIEQSRNSRYFDSSLIYSKTKDLPSADGLSLRQLQNRAKGLVPDDSKAKGLAGGLSSFDAGMFPKNSSRFTMNGQMIRGLDGGYDLGLCEAGATIGKTEYIGRDGSLDKYTCYAGAVNLRPAEKQTVSFIYYGYSPDRALTAKDAFFSNRVYNISAPAFFRPIHIFAATYDATFFDNITLASEVATSFYNFKPDSLAEHQKLDRMAYHLEGNGSIPHTPVTLHASYNKVGKDFQNSTLPITLAGTTQYEAGVRSDVFRSLLTVGIEYYYLVQQNFNVKGSNTRWGFDAKTNFKRYPNLYVSYKPFATFRSVTDTFSIPQRPLFGAVWTGKLVYNYKRKTDFYRFSILYNRNTTVMDTIQTGSELVQASAGYTGKKYSWTVNIGQTANYGTGANDSVAARVKFAGLSGSYDITRQLKVTGDQNIGFADFGLCRYSAMAGIIVRPEYFPMTFGVNFRYNKLLLNPWAQWKEIYSGSIDIGYQFKKRRSKT